MKLTISSKTLLKALQTVGNVINYSHSMPILQNFKFEITDKLTITATDLDTTLSCVIDGEGEGAICIPAKLIIDALKALPDQPITLSSTGSVLLLIATSGKYKLPCSDASEFPNPVEIKEASVITMPAEILAEGINKTIIVTDNENPHTFMCCVLFRVLHDKMIFVGTNGQKLSEYTRSDIKSDESLDFLIHKKSLNVLKALLTAGDLVIECNGTNAMFRFENLIFTLRLVDAKYPNYEAVVPKNNPLKVKVDRHAILSSVKRVSLFANSYSKQILLDINPGSIRLTSTDADFSTDAEEIIKTDYDDQPIKIAFNHRFFVEVVSSMQCDEMLLELSLPNKGAILTQLDGLDKEESTLLMVMPQAI
jgi:DNA polymerase-3 subunit beta